MEPLAPSGMGNMDTPGDPQSVPPEHQQEDEVKEMVFPCFSFHFLAAV